MIEAIYHAVRKRRVPLLGICLGMQLLGESSEEGTLRGLALIPGRNERFRLSDRGLKVPHMSWNVAEVARSHSLFDGREETARYYFVHSYHFICDEPRHSLAHTVYGIRFNSAVESENVTGVQFHPEKSLRWGMEILRRFAQHV